MNSTAMTPVLAALFSPGGGDGGSGGLGGGIAAGGGGGGTADVPPLDDLPCCSAAAGHVAREGRDEARNSIGTTHLVESLLASCFITSRYCSAIVFWSRPRADSEDALQGEAVAFRVEDRSLPVALGVEG